MEIAVIVIDVQRALFEQVPRPFEADEVIQRINALTARARAQGVPVAYVQHRSNSGDLAYQSEGWQLAGALEIDGNDVVIAKTTPDSFLRTTLDDWLQEHEVKRVVLCGGMTEFCVDTTTRSAAAFGYEVILAADAHTTHDKPHADAEQIRAHHNATLPNITSFGPTISAVNSADIHFN